jgi:hypothetical protein
MGLVARSSLFVGCVISVTTIGATAWGQGSCQGLGESDCTKRRECVFVRPLEKGIASPGYCTSANRSSAAKSTRETPFSSELARLVPADTDTAEGRLDKISKLKEQHALVVSQLRKLYEKYGIMLIDNTFHAPTIDIVEFRKEMLPIHGRFTEIAVVARQFPVDQTLPKDAADTLRLLTADLDLHKLQNPAPYDGPHSCMSSGKKALCTKRTECVWSSLCDERGRNCLGVCSSKTQ